MTDMSNIPQPPIKPLIGNLRDLDTSTPVQSLMALAQDYGPIFKVRIIDREIIVVSSQELVDELSDETRFRKAVHAPLQEIRAFAGDGLFTAYGTEPNWAKAHAILMPAFGPIGVRDMFDDMVDIADQMFSKWERFGTDGVIDVPDNMTRLTLDTIALSAFGYRFNSFYSDKMHPFVDAMVGALSESGARTRRPKIMTNLKMSTARQYQKDIVVMKRVVDDLIKRRRSDPDQAAKTDLLGRMLNGRDPKTGQRLSDENIMNQMITFLIAGHETTSGLLSFAVYELLRNPEVLREARALVDVVLGDDMPTLDHMPQLRFIEQILMETLRLWPTAPIFGLNAVEPTTLAGKYELTEKDMVMVLIPTLHRDRDVWGEDVEAFRPGRFAPDAAATLPPNAWKPFGNGARACIGRPFATQEAQLVLSMMLQRFDFALDDPSYQLKIHETLTLKPENLRIRARARRTGTGLRRSQGAVPVAPVAQQAPAAEVKSDAAPLLVLYGSNTGSSEAFARRIAEEAPAQGFAPRVAAMDDVADALPTSGAVVVVTASYEGQPPDNAARFMSHVEGLESGALNGVSYAVFGCGNRQWARTYQAIPKRVDAALEAAGASRVHERGEGDSGGDFFGSFDAWIAGMWPTLGAAFGKDPAEAPQVAPLQLDFVSGGRSSLLRIGELDLGEVIENRELVDMTAEGARSKRHIEIRLPDGMTYAAGDYLAVLASNPDDLVDRALRRFGLSHDKLVVLHREGGSALPLDHPVAIGEVLANYVELGQPATRSQVERLRDLTRCPPERAALEQLSADYDDAVLGRRMSVLDLLAQFESTPLQLAEFLSMLPPMKARQYSISSSPLWKPDHVTLTVAVVDAPAQSGIGQYRGVASTFLAELAPGDRIAVAVRPSQTRFHPPADPQSPMVLICAGSGIAPFRGFLQDRAEMKAKGQEVGPALLYFGTNNPKADFLYEDELTAWEAEGIVSVRPVFSDLPRDGQQFVQHRLWAERDEVAGMFEDGATFYTCGDGKLMAPAVRETLLKIIMDKSGMSQDEAQTWADRMERDHGRYVADVFA